MPAGTHSVWGKDRAERGDPAVRLVLAGVRAWFGLDARVRGLETMT